MQMKRLFLIDGHALIFRMYYAFIRRPMINSKGVDTSILFGFTKYILELIKKESPTHIAVMFDPPAKTFRHEMYPDYKANRSAAPELVKEALDPLTEIVHSFGMKVLMVPGYEADDVIGTAAKQFASDDCQVYMVTPDKDLGQIVDKNIFQFKPGKSGADNEIVTEKKLCGEYGIENPRQVIDILTLWGDSSDNVRGVPGVGEVGARKLVGKYGSVDNIYQHLDELSAKQQEAFRSAEAYIKQSRDLVTICTEVPIDATLDQLKLRNPDSEKVSELFNRYEFNSLRQLLPTVEFKQESKGNSVVCEETDFASIAALARAKGAVAIRKSKDFILCVETRYCHASQEKAAEILMDGSIDKTGYSLKGTPAMGNLYDIELMHYLINPERTHKLEILASSYLNLDLSYDNFRSTSTPSPLPDLFSTPEDSADTILPETGNTLVAREAAVIWLLFPLLKNELEQKGLWKLYLTIEMPLIKVLDDMEKTGVRIDTERLRTYSQELTGEMLAVENQARELVNDPMLNLSSPRQVGNVIFEKLKLDPHQKKKNDSYPTDEETLRELEDKHPFVGKILEFRALKKLLSTYIDPLPELIDPNTNKVHTTFNQALTATGRLSSVKPNLQNIPIRTERGSRIREAFVASYPQGCIVSADYSQIELRLMAHLSGDKAMISAFNNEADIHRATAAHLAGKAPQDVTPEERRHAKVANFGIIYGISAFGLAQRMEISRTAAKEFIEEYFVKYPGVRAYMDRSIEEAREKGYVETMFGRRRYLPDINSRNFNVRSLAERNAINAPIQGSAADIIKLAMVNVWNRLHREEFKSRMILQVHDELVFDVVDGERDALMTMVKEEMENVCKLSIPLIAECNYGTNWKEAH